MKLYIVNRFLISSPEYVYDTRASTLQKLEKNKLMHKQLYGEGSGFFFVMLDTLLEKKDKIPLSDL